MSSLDQLYDAHLTIAGHPITWRGDPRQRVRVRLGRRRPAPPGLGLAGRHRRQRAAVHRLHRRDLRADAQVPLFGQAGRQVFFIITSIYGWWRWQRGAQAPRRRRDRPAITPRWATARERVGYLVAGRGRGRWCCSGVLQRDRRRLARRRAGTTGATPGSSSARCVATYAMARGWNDFWLAWIAVDLVGVPAAVALAATTRPRPVRRLRRPGGLGLLRVAARRPAGRARRPEPRRCAHERPRTVRLDTVERAVADIAAGKAGRGRRRRGPRERGRPDLRGQQGRRRS